MLRSLPRVALLASLLAVGNGCYAGTVRHRGHHHHGGGDGALLAVGLIAGAAIVAASTEHHHHRRAEPVYVREVVYVNGPPPAPLPASPRDRATAELPAGFDAQAARAALSRVDLSACRDAGAPRGYGHAKVTFNPDGRASKVVVDTPAGLSAPAVKCIGDRLGTVTVSEYDGSLVTVGSTWFVP
jgi:hypothetical protein